MNVQEDSGLDLSPPRVFIVDDDPSFGRSLQRLLETSGVEANCFSSARSFLESDACDRTNGIAIIDIHMPDCDGFDLVDCMRSEGWELPVILITGRPSPEMEAQSQRRQVIGLLIKPFSKKALLALIRSRAEAVGG